jgi:hypothetical protein
MVLFLPSPFFFFFFLLSLFRDEESVCPEKGLVVAERVKRSRRCPKIPEMLNEQ